MRASSDVFSVVSSYTFNNTIAAFAPSIKLSRARGTRAVPVAVNALDTIGTIGWNAQGTTDHQIANIQCTAPANAGADAISSQLTFATSLTSDVLPVARMTIAPSGDVGIGTASPIGTLDVRAANPTIVCSNSAIRYGYSTWVDASSEFRTGTGGAHPFVLLTSNTEKMRITATGNVGIGTASPVSPLHAFGTSITAASTTTASNGILRVAGSATNALFCGAFSDSPFGMCLQTNSASYPLVLQPAGGNVGINTASPTSALDVAGTITCAVSGQGIKLATAPANTDPQTLDCYAEGTWTPALTGFGGTAPTVATARYTRIGRVVTLQVKLSATAAATFSSAAGATFISLPAAMAAAVEAPGATSTSGIAADGPCVAYTNGNLYLPTFALRTADTFLNVTYTV